ncbi:hypothetical protein WISP_02002 [Willisornis vidua]|uniref:CPLX3 protein n=1 Tax=Willisornis vidua TaxID=1566151 RepID=A0ABQ9DYU0_9PASS|nr:hypothetical protein WISP_02002 [Willisornis vidua]
MSPEKGMELGKGLEHKSDEAEREAARLEQERRYRERLEKLEAKYQEQKESELEEDGTEVSVCTAVENGL